MVSKVYIPLGSCVAGVGKPMKDGLWISELYGGTIQGEGVYTGVPAIFLRLSGCTLNCTWCDTKDIWKTGTWFTHQELLERFDFLGLPTQLRDGTHLVITGGSPLRQQKELIEFLKLFHYKFGFIPFIEMENECVLHPEKELRPYISCWNNSPKLENSGVRMAFRYKPEVLKKMNFIQNSWFKFVVTSEKDVEEIVTRYILFGLISREKVILMPEGADRITLDKNREKVIELAVRYGFRYSDRLHIIVWDKKKSV